MIAPQRSAGVTAPGEVGTALGKHLNRGAAAVWLGHFLSVSFCTQVCESFDSLYSSLKGGVPFWRLGIFFTHCRTLEQSVFLILDFPALQDILETLRSKRHLSGTTSVITQRNYPIKKIRARFLFRNTLEMASLDIFTVLMKEHSELGRGRPPTRPE